LRWPLSAPAWRLGGFGSIEPDRPAADGPLTEIVAMKEFAAPPRVTLSPRRLQACFLSILAKIQTHARIFFRHVRCRCKRDDFIAETVALAWNWFKRMAQKGKDATRFPTALASYAAKAVRCGRRAYGQMKAQDVLNEHAQQRHGFYVSKLPDFSTLSENPLAEALIDNTRSPVPEQVMFRLDFPSWLTTRTERDRRIINDMAMGQRTLDLSKRYGISPGRISQLRREFLDDLLKFCDDFASKN